jgi:phosphinothricin acetyltransferase
LIDAKIRLAEASDVDAIRRIYNHYVENSTCTYQIEPDSYEQRLDWFRAHDARHPVTVFSSAGSVVGWAALTQWSPRRGYWHTAEVSIYVDHRWHRRGIGRALLADLIERSVTLGYHVLIGGISTEQTASLQLHKSLGFVEVACFKEVGYKFDKWLDVAFLQLTLPPDDDQTGESQPSR